MISRVLFWRVAFVISAFLLTILLMVSDSYWAIYWSMFSLLFFSTKIVGVTIRFLAYFFMVYLGIALLDISNYRGSIELQTLRLYCQMVLLVFSGLFLCDFFAFRAKLNRSSYEYQSAITVNQKNVIMAHLAIVYLAVAYVYASKGMVIFNQDLRFYIPTSVAYVVKSSIYIPLVYWASRCFKDRFGCFLYVLLPLLPAILIGSRGTVIMILLGMILIQMLQSLHYQSIKGEISVKFSSKIFVWVSLFGGGMIYLLYYIRRMAADSHFLTPSEALNEYFYSDSWVGYLLMPLHLGFKETLGLTNRIVIDQLDNDYTSTPLFITDLVTILPGKQMGAGEAMADMFGAVASGGLTPGILGGLYVDFLGWSIAIIFLIVVILYTLEFLSRCGDKWLVIYALSLVQFMHLFHRGFIKPEYLFAYVIVAVYLKFGFFYKRKI